MTFYFSFIFIDMPDLFTSNNILIDEDLRHA